MHERRFENGVLIINEFVDYLNTFNPEAVKEFLPENEISKSDYDIYKKAINAVLSLTQRTDRAEEYKEKARIANEYLDNLKMI